MKQSVTFSQFVDAFRAHDRQEQFSYGALRVLFDEFEDYEDQTGSEIELDVIAICCEYVEMDLQEVVDSYGLEDLIDYPDMGEAAQTEVVIEWLIDRTWFMGKTSTGSLVFQQF